MSGEKTVLRCANQTPANQQVDCFTGTVIPELSNRCDRDAHPSPGLRSTTRGITGGSEFLGKGLVCDEYRVKADHGPVDRRVVESAVVAGDPIDPRRDAT